MNIQEENINKNGSILSMIGYMVHKTAKMMATDSDILSMPGTDDDSFETADMTAGIIVDEVRIAIKNSGVNQ